ncbi:MAG: HlyD family efflux transporter periplasmic adaptor subunit [Anaerolineae bacterium]|nr:HlyD family efflux transporter periplasmic adaptor subunit [Anaerolineae bacterium]
MYRKRVFWIVAIALVLAAGGGYAAYAYWLAPEEIVEEGSTLQTAAVTVGDLSITADGTGMLVASSEVDLAFGASGTLMELLVEVGDEVQAGDVLAWINDTDARKAVVDAELAVLQAEEALENAGDLANLEQAVAQAELGVTQAQADLEAAALDLDELLNWTPDEAEIEIAEVDLTIAQASYQNAIARANMYEAQITSARVSLAQAITALEEAQAYYRDVMDGARDWDRNIEDIRAAAAKSLQKAEDSLEIAQANYSLATVDTRVADVQNAWVKVLNAQEALEDLRTSPEEADIVAARIVVQQREVALQQAVLDLEDAQEAVAGADTAEAELTLQQTRLRLESAQQALDDTTLVAPISGTVVAVNAEPGEKVNGTVVALADMVTPIVQFWVEESDLNSVAVGHRVNLVFEALPDLTYSGEIVRVDPVLVDVSGTPAVQVWASIDTAAHPVKLLGDMNVEVEIVAGEAQNALLVPVGALRELGDDQYAVFVVQDSGELEMRMVEVGLMDYVNAEVLSGLQRGEVVSTGETTSSSSNQTVTGTTQTQFTPPMGFFGG